MDLETCSQRQENLQRRNTEIASRRACGQIAAMRPSLAISEPFLGPVSYMPLHGMDLRGGAHDGRAWRKVRNFHAMGTKRNGAAPLGRDTITILRHSGHDDGRAEHAHLRSSFNSMRKFLTRTQAPIVGSHWMTDDEHTQAAMRGMGGVCNVYKLLLYRNIDEASASRHNSNAPGTWDTWLETKTLGP